ncbi:MAG: glycosyl hydrolase family 8, partial [Patescibacteria group bacterium]
LLFVIASQYAGSTIINVPELPPYGFFNNVRYGLTFIGFVILAPLVLLHAAQTSRNRFLSALLAIGRSAVLFALLLFSGFQFQRVALAERFDTIRRDVNSPSPEQRETARFLREHYRGGSILLSRSDNDPIIAEAGIPLRRYIYEGNYRFFDQALREPWNFAQWIVMHNPASSPDPWAEQYEQVYRTWGMGGEPPPFYALAFENARRKVYRLSEDAFRSFAEERGYNAHAIPSLNGGKVWEPQTVYTSMRVPGKQSTLPDETVSKASVSGELRTLYERRLKPDFARGYYVDAEGAGTSESQSYALWQSFLMGDRATFDAVWRWTKLNVQRPDGLFQWKFALQGDILIILDGNAATDADTDIAYLLLRAGKEWGREDYVADALPVIRSIWENETAESAKGRHLTAGNWAATPAQLTLNPSYFSPHAYRLFSAHDPDHAWEEVIVQGYEDLEAASARPVGDIPDAFLPPDWVSLDRRTGAFIPYAGKEGGSDYSYDAFRTFFRIALDASLSQDGRARRYLLRATTFERDWPKRGTACSIYPASGSGCSLDVDTLAGPLAVWTVTQPRFAENAVRTFYVQDGVLDLSPVSAFYEKSWQWFGLWFWSNTNAGRLP